MSLTLLLATLMLPLPLQQDASVAVSSGDRLVVSDLAGDLEIRTSTRNLVTLDTRRSDGRVSLRRSDRTVHVSTDRRRGGGMPHADAVLTIPAWMPVSVNGVNLDVDIAGIEAPVRIETVNGDIDVVGGRGQIELISVSGDVTLRNANGRIVARSVNGEVEVTDSDGDITAETTNGEIDLARVRAGSVSATSVNGTITYDGTITPDGRYTFGTHNGSLTVTIPEDARATVNVSTYRGDFTSDFPVVLSEGRLGSRFRFLVGNGGAVLQLESFQGSITLRRAGDRRRR